MRTAGAHIAALLLLFAITEFKVRAAGDLYWEGEEDASNEFLEVKDDAVASLNKHHQRHKRDDWFTFPSFSLFDTPKSDAGEAVTESDDVGKDDDLDNFGSGSQLDKIEPEPTEKTLRVTFTVQEPYRKAYSDRDTPEFRQFSQSLASAVDQLFEKLPGTQRTSLVRIQSHINDEFSCKVTLDIVTSGYEDTENIKKVLWDRIKKYRLLGEYPVNENDFSAQLIDPGTTLDCDDSEFKCDEDRCLPMSFRCNQRTECADGSDELNCSPTTTAYDPYYENPVDQTGYDQTRQDIDDPSNVGQGEQDPYDDGSSPQGPEDPNAYPYQAPQKPDEDQRRDDLNSVDQSNPVPQDPYDFGSNPPQGPEPEDPNAYRPDQVPEQNTDSPNPSSDNPDDGSNPASGYPEDPYTNLDPTPQSPDQNTLRPTAPPTLDDQVNQVDSEQRGDGGRVDGTVEQTEAPAPATTASSWWFWSSSDTTTQSVVTTPAPDVCAPSDFRCDQTRCMEPSKRCDRYNDCDDGTDELGCPPETCAPDDFRCYNGMCIESSKRCNRVYDCSNQEDEIGCDCSQDEFRCQSDGRCIEARKRCDGEQHCPDGSDELDCACGPDQWQCDHGNCIKRKFRCNGRVDCPTDRSDERNCIATGYFKCKSGKLIPEHLRCNRQYDCPQDDLSDEHNCPCRPGDFKCDNGHCIPKSKHCDRTHDCQDGSDERYCTYGSLCMAYQYECKSGMCVPAEAKCNGIVECDDRSDEANCNCKRGQYTCRDGSCINIAYLCNGHEDCAHGEDEYNCRTFGKVRWLCNDGTYVSATSRCDGQYDCPDRSDEKNCEPPCRSKEASCPAGQFTCLDGSNTCAVKCNGEAECYGGEDEADCDDVGDEDLGDCPQDAHSCDNKCVPESQICDGRQDCSDNSDETGCETCVGPDDFRCTSGDCVNFSLRCNGIAECSDGSDEYNCDQIMVPANEQCSPDEFQCRTNLNCIDMHFFCDGNDDCLDKSDEANCQCPADSFPCRDGQCVPSSGYCDGNRDCRDGSDESECSWSTTQRTYVLPTTSRAPPTTVNYPMYTTTARPDLYPSRGESGRWPQQPDSGDLNGGRGLPGLGSTGGGRGQGGCSAYEWRCENGPCINASRRCDGHIDCPLDYSDEFDCPPNSPVALKITTYPEIETVRDGGDVVLQCRDEGPERARVQWRKEGGSIKQGSTDVRGRLEMFKVGPDDSGTYICAAVNFAGYPGAEKRVTLNVIFSSVTTTAPFRACLPHQATCASGQCIPKSSVCNGRKDCEDNSDEENCHHGGMCEPNEFKCKNRKCVLKSWLCDSENDCGDGSDEQDCGAKEPGQCSRNEFACHTNNQCVPRSFHCDHHPDCFDGTDELGCREAYIKSPPKPSNLKLNAGDTLTLRCEAVGVPMPIISWRLNWGHVPSQCTSTSVNGLGVLTCENMQPKDSGAYSCEAINNKEALFATPDAIVFVTKTDICPPGYFNSEARSESECIRCFCFDSSDQCHSADLFTFNMPTDFGVGGTRLVGVQASPSGEVTIDPQSITSQYFYQPLRNGATVTKFSDGPAWSNSYPYLTLPEVYNGNQLKSYGGHIRYTLSPQTQIFSSDNTAPTIIIKGKYGNLFHVNRVSGTRDINIEARFTPEGWSKYPDGSQPAQREDIMMVLVDIEMTLLRADLNNAGVNISRFVMETADHFNAGIGAASLVEECTCPTGYEGLSCQKCASGFVRKKVGPWLGPCQPAAPEVCASGTYGDPSSGIPCKPCPCPLTNKGNQFASTCSLGPDGSVYCDCFPGYQGPRCNECAPGFEGNPMIPGNSCQPKPSDNCNPIGTKTIRPPDECVCKDQVQGRYCDSCKNDSFFLSEDYSEGCARCFCLGESQTCVSSTYRRKAITAQFNVPQIVEQINVYSSAPAGPRSSVRYSVPTITDLRPELVRGELSANHLERGSRAKVFYWSMPLSFAGDKVTSYGGFLRYTLKNVPVFVDPRYSNTAPSVQLISENQLTFHYVRDFNATHDGFLNGNAQFLENEWKRPDGKDVSRPELILALADVKAILIKATYAPGSPMATPMSASIEIAEPNAYGPIAFHVEQCVCPPEYIGTSCEDCRPGYTRSSSGLYLEHCAPCQCNGKASNCDPETGKCYDCKDNTDGDFCEKCKPGFETDENGNCVDTRRQPIPCGCDPRGTSEPCDDAGNCYCKRNVEGNYCDRCRPATFGLEASNPDGCLSCFCSGVTTDCHEGDDYVRLPLGAPVLGEDFGGFTLTDIRAERVIKSDFVPVFEQSELVYVMQFNPDIDLYWSVPKFPGNRVLSYGGTMSLRQKFAADEGVLSERGTDVVFDGGDMSIFWTNPHQMRSGESYTYQVPITEKDWFILNTATPVTRTDFMKVLRNLKRVLVRATLARNIYETSIGDVSMDTASQLSDEQLSVAKGIEICRCPEGYSGTSCEQCQLDYYRDQSGYCRKCPCNGYGCQLNSQGQVICNCRAPFTGPDCSVTGLVMELHPTIREEAVDSPFLRRVTFTCKYRAPEPLTIKFYHEGLEQPPHKYFNESTLELDGYHGEHSWQTVWDVREQGEIYECHTFTERGFTHGVLTTSLPETGDPEATTRPQVPQPPPTEPTVTVTITSPILKIQEIGGRVSFICQAQSRNTRARLPVTWTKSDGFLPLERTELNEAIGELVINNVQVSDSGKYICETTDGITSAQAIATLNVPSNTMTVPTVEILPSAKDYYVGEHIQLECRTSGNPAPTINWLRGVGRPLPLSVDIRGNWLFIDGAQVEDSGEYRCIATNTVGSTSRTAMITVRPRPISPPSDKLVVSNTAPTINEGQSIRVVCTGTTNVPAGSLDWVRKDNTAFMTNVRSDNGVLYVEYAEPDNQGVYICHSSLSNVTPIQVLLTVMATNPNTDVYNITVTSDRLKIPTGGSGSVDCNPVSAVPVIRWSKYGSERLGSESSQRGNTLIINNAQDSDQGYYICEAVNSNGDSINTIYVFVEIERREPPRVEIWPPGEQAVQLGGQHELHCRILGGIPTPDVIWNRNGGRPLTSSTQILPNNILKFFKIDVNDEGTYTCTAHNDAGNANASAVVKVRSAPEITITPQEEITVYIGEPIKVECRAKGIPEPTVSISLENTQLIAPQPRLAVLQVSSANQQDAGYYTCTASSPAGSITEQFFVDVIDRGDGGSTDDFDAEGSGEDPNIPEPWPPQLPRNVYILEGKPEAIIYCNESGNVQWRRDDNNPLQSNAYQINTKLIIANASKSDSGRYVCDIYNIYNEIQHAVTTNLVVVTPLRIQLRPQKQTVQPGQSPTVECVVNGDGVTGVYWQPYNRQSSERMEIRNNKLIFHEIEVEDAGQYECIAKGHYTNASSIAEVIVSEYSDRPRVSHAHEQRAHAGSAVHLRCNATQRYARIAWTKDGTRVPGSVTLKSDGSLFIQLAHKSDSGRYVCLIKDDNGRTLTSSYIDLHIQGYTRKCLETQFRCNDGSGCVEKELLCDGRRHCRDSSDEDTCLGRNKRFSDSIKDAALDGRRVPSMQQLVNIEQPRRVFRVGDNARIHCTTRNPRVRVQWIRPGTMEYVNSMPYGDGAVLSIQSVTFADSGVYRCVGKEGTGRESYVDLQLIVESGSGDPSYPQPGDSNIAEYTAHLRNQIDIPCVHVLEGPVTVEWRREFLPLPAGVRSNQPTLHLDSVTEADAGTYVCRISNSRVAIETRVVLTVKGVVPMFNGESYVALPRLKDAYNKFEIEISFKPQDENGLIFYNAETENGQDGDFIALELKDGIPTFTMKTSIIAVTILKNDRPLTLNTWHTIRISRTDAKVTMDVDNTGPFFASSPKRLQILDLNQQLYIGGVPDHIQLPEELAGASGLIGCVSILILGKEEKSIMMDSENQQGITECNSCNPNLCHNSGFCQEARNERGYVCICTNGFAGLNCDRTGEACQPGLCGPGKCSDTDNGYKCACPVTHTGRNCEINQTIGYPAFAGSAYLAIQQPKSFRSLKMSMNIKAAAPVTDGIIMYCAETRRGYGGFTALTVHNGKLEFRYDLGGDIQPVVLVSNRTLPANQWTNVHISRIGAVVSMKVNKVHAYEQMLDASYQGSDLHFDTPVFVGGVDEDITLNKETGVTGGFSGCIKDFTMFEQAIDIVNKTIKSANVQECVAAVDDRGDIPEEAGDGCQCRNGGQCYPSGTDIFCVCPPGYTGQYCESRAPSFMTRDRPENPCNVGPCRNGGTCKPDFNARMNHTCDCPLGYAGDYCQIPVELLQSVGFSGNGYLELPASMLRYDNMDVEPALFAMAIHSTNDGVLLYQKEVQSPYYGDYILLRINRGIVEMEWNLGSGKTVISVGEVFVIDGERHQIIGQLMSDGQGSLSVDGHQAIGTSPGISNVMAADSNIYIGGIPDHINQQGYAGFDGCIEQVELMSSGRSLQLGREAVAGRNTQRCKEPRI